MTKEEVKEIVKEMLLDGEIESFITINRDTSNWVCINAGLIINGTKIEHTYDSVNISSDY